MVKLIQAPERHFTSAGWLQSYFLFSFADYYDPKNIQFGPLRVFNDDYIAPNNGFPPHPHSEMEIISIILEGEISHQDSMGNKTAIKAGEVQRMTAGTGITHSERNDTDKPLHIYQLWFFPNKKSLAPAYEQKKIDFLGSKNELVPLVTGQKVLEDVVFMNSNSTIYYCNLHKEKDLEFKTFPLRYTFIYITEGSMFVNGIEAGKNDQLRIEKEDVIVMKAETNCSFILIDLPASEANY
jgi:quercetin 2,3-dioxygenase